MALTDIQKTTSHQAGRRSRSNENRRVVPDLANRHQRISYSGKTIRLSQRMAGWLEPGRDFRLGGRLCALPLFH